MLQTLRGEIRKIAAAHPDTDPVMLARRLLNSFKKADLIQCLADEIAHEQRGVARAVETSAFAAFFSSAQPPADVERLRQVFSVQFKLGDTFMTSWGAATVGQHRQRIAMLSKLRDGLEATIRRHETAIELIEQHGVQCLNEIEGLSEAA